MPKMFFSLVLLLAPWSAGGVSALSVDFAGGAYSSDSPVVPAPVAGKAAVPAAIPPNAEPRKWTVMVFMNGKNDLELAGLYNVNQMEKVGSDENVNIVVELGRMKGQKGDTAMDGNWTGGRRIYVRKDKNTTKITSPVVDKVKTVDMGDYKRAADFVKWAKKKYPAEKYMLILWDHGLGWLDPRREPEVSGQKGISFDDETGNYIRTKQIGDILKEAGGVDVLAFDACLMQMGEVAFEVKDHTGVIIGSEEVVPGMGYPYNLFLGALVRNPGMSGEQLGKIVVAAFKGFYDVVKQSAQLSAIRSGKLNDFGVKMRDFAAAAKGLDEPAAFNGARAGVMRYDMLGPASDPKMAISFYGDAHQYAGLLAAGLKGTDEKTAAVKARAADLQDFIDRQLVIANGASGKDRVGRALSESHGVSVYLPPVSEKIDQEKLEGIFEGKYTDFEFDKATGWHDFVTFLYGVR